MSKKTIKPVAGAIGAAIAGSMMLAGGASATSNPFGMAELGSGYMQVASADMEGKCGGNMKAKPMEGKCGGNMKAKPMEGKCGANMKSGTAKKKDGKCGTGKCGSNR